MPASNNLSVEDLISKNLTNFIGRQETNNKLIFDK